MVEATQLLLKALITLFLFVVGATISLLSAFLAMIALFGSGALTADPPPERPDVFAASMIGLSCVAVLGGLGLLWRKLMNLVDKMIVGE